MKPLTGHDRAVIVAHWIRTKPVDKKDVRIPIEVYVKQVCKQKGWQYKPPVKRASDE